MKEATGKTKNVEQGRVARRRARVRADLLAAARQVFTAHGYQNATISEIIQVADVAIGTFYLHFRDKEDVMVALAEETRQRLGEQVHAVIAHHPDKPLIPLIVHTILRTAYEQRDLFMLICAGESHLIAASQTHQAHHGLQQLFLPAFQAAREVGEPGSYDPALYAHLLVGMLMWAINWWFEQDEPGPDSMADHILSLLAHGLPPTLLTMKEYPTP